MGFTEFMQNLFCGDLKTRIVKLDKQISDAMLRIKTALGSIHLDAPFEVQVNRLCELYESEKKKVKNFSDEVTQLDYTIVSLEKKIEVLTDTLADRFAIPVIDPVLTGAQVLDPWNYPWPQPSMVHISDNRYEVYGYEVWEKIIQRVWPTVNVVQGRYIAEKGDCDNFAGTMSSFAGLSFRDSSSKLQGAWLVVYSRGHAFCAFIDDQMRMWLVEPQSGEILGEYRSDSEVYGERYREIYRFDMRN